MSPFRVRHSHSILADHWGEARSGGTTSSWRSSEGASLLTASNERRSRVHCCCCQLPLVNFLEATASHNSIGKQATIFRQLSANFLVQRRRSRSWRRRAQQMERSAPRNPLRPPHHGKRWRRKQLLKRVKISSAPPASPATTFSSSNHCNGIDRHGAAPIPSAGNTSDNT